jgi:predicted porin
MKKFGVALAIAIASAGAAHAADILPTTKPAETPPPVNCFASVWTYLDSTPADCPLSYAGFTVYSTLDWGFGWESHGSGYTAAWNNGVNNFINKQSGINSQWLQTPNGLSQSVVGVKMSEPLPFLDPYLGPGWSLIGTWEMGFNPYWGYLADAQRSQVQNNGKALTLQTANNDSSRTGQWDNSQAFIGVSNPTYGTLTVGRVNTLSLDAINSYDPMGGSYAFSPLGYSGSYAGFGDTEAARANTAVKYRINFLGNYRAAGLVQWGGYDQGNGTTGLYQGQVGADFHNPWGGTLSFDAIGSYAQNVVNLSNFTGTCATFTSGPFAGQTGCSDGVPKFYSNTDLKATLSNNIGLLLAAKYIWGPVTLYSGWGYIRQMNPSNDYLNGFSTIGGWNVPATIPSTFPDAKTLWPTAWTTYNAYNIQRVAPYVWIGGKYAITPQLDVVGAFYYLQQNNYNSSTTPCAYANTTFVEPTGYKFTVSRINSGSCAGTQDAISYLIDYRPIKRVDLYAGVMISNVYGGLANGYQETQLIAPTAGLRVKF